MEIHSVCFWSGCAIGGQKLSICGRDWMSSQNFRMKISPSRTQRPSFLSDLSWKLCEQPLPPACHVLTSFLCRVSTQFHRSELPDDETTNRCTSGQVSANMFCSWQRSKVLKIMKCSFKSLILAFGVLAKCHVLSVLLKKQTASQKVSFYHCVLPKQACAISGNGIKYRYIYFFKSLARKWKVFFQFPESQLSPVSSEMLEMWSCGVKCLSSDPLNA